MNIVKIILIAIFFLPAAISLVCFAILIVGTIAQAMGIIEADNGKHYHSSDCNEGI